MRWNFLNTKIGVAFGGGAAKGIAHIGVLKAFEEKNIKISYVSGTSVGAIVASYYAFGKNYEDFQELAKKLNYKDSISWTIPKKGFFSTKSIREMIIKDLGDVNIEDAQIPLAICTTDISTGEQVIFHRGNLADAICASVCVPGAFIPQVIEGRTLVDGGITENVPVSPLYKMGAGIIVAVDLNGVQKYQEPDDTFAIISNAMDIAIDLRTREQIQDADIILSLDLSKYNRLNNSKCIEELINEGYRPMIDSLSSLSWYRNANYLEFLKKLIIEFLPFRIPRVISNIYKKKLSQIFIK
ncbi:MULTISPECIES: patatin-like phospholipase family protein [unclassified Halobacteriovorax]|uniref:patatin-like phospholipase family protein n=1 Tax=unclassified Halobacteriovorax TaxID=2639665 RepID=UPI000EA35246|nr:patatin-like phospholipase family protein [Halobacteriovorax sp. BALOs_7]AYF43594.1 phospholipase, patatin family [Halobacteriovorax sp. BALOs_7]